MVQFARIRYGLILLGRFYSSLRNWVHFCRICNKWFKCVRFPFKFFFKVGSFRGGLIIHYQFPARYGIINLNIYSNYYIPCWDLLSQLKFRMRRLLVVLLFSTLRNILDTAVVLDLMAFQAQQSSIRFNFKFIIWTLTSFYYTVKHWQ